MAIRAPKRASRNRTTGGRSADSAAITDAVLKKLRPHLEEAVEAGFRESDDAKRHEALLSLLQRKGAARVRVEGDRVLLALGIEGVLDAEDGGGPAKELDLAALLTDVRLYASECRQLAACLRGAAKRLDNLADEKIAAGWGIRPIH